jgi:hypothetical protein
MPSLDDDQQKALREHVHTCHGCKNELRQNYCRSCDLFFYVGHAAGCEAGTYDEDHTGHRTY